MARKNRRTVTWKRIPKEEYREYIQSGKWQETRKRFWRSKLPKECYCCGVKNVALDLHHRTYKSLGHENLSHLVLVCRPCHEKIHEIQKTTGMGIWRATKIARKRILREHRVSANSEAHKIAEREAKKSAKKIKLEKKPRPKISFDSIPKKKWGMYTPDERAAIREEDRRRYLIRREDFIARGLLPRNAMLPPGLQKSP